MKIKRAFIIIFVLSIMLNIFLINIKAEVYNGPHDDNWEFWRWYEAINIDNDGTIQIWIKATIKFNETLDRDCKFSLIIPAEKNQIKYYIAEGEENKYFFLKNNSDSPGYSSVDITINKSAVSRYEYFPFILIYNVSKNSILTRTSAKYQTIDRWRLDMELKIDEELFGENLSNTNVYHRLRLFIILPQKAYITLSEKFKYVPKTDYGRDIDKFETLSFRFRNGSGVDYKTPFQIPINDLVLNYTSIRTPDNIFVEYSIENETFSEFTYKAMQAGIDSKIISEISLSIAIISLILGGFSIFIAIKSSRVANQSKNISEKSLEISNSSKEISQKSNKKMKAIVNSQFIEIYEELQYITLREILPKITKDTAEANSIRSAYLWKYNHSLERAIQLREWADDSYKTQVILPILTLLERTPWNKQMLKNSDIIDILNGYLLIGDLEITNTIVDDIEEILEKTIIKRNNDEELIECINKTQRELEKHPSDRFKSPHLKKRVE